AGAGACQAVSELKPLQSAPALEQAAAQVADGVPLAAAVQASGYRTRRVLYIRIDDVAQWDPALRTTFCEQLVESSARAMGVFPGPNDIHVLIATSFRPVVRSDNGDPLVEMLALVNQARAEPRKCGTEDFSAAAPVRWNATLAAAAWAHARDMAQRNYIGHD